MVNKYLVIFMLLFNIVVKYESARILAVLPVPVISHQSVFRVLTQELARRGHHVTIITPLPVFAKGQAPINYTEIDISQATSTILKKLVTEEIKVSDLYSQFINTFTAAVKVMDSLLGLKEVQNLVEDKSIHFDLIFVEDCLKSTLVFSHIFKAPVIQISSFGGTFDTFEAVGAITHPILYPLAVRQKYHSLSALEKISELFLLYRLQKSFNDGEMMENEMLKKHFGMNTPNLKELKKNIHMLFLNIHPIWDSNRPVPTNVVYLGGLHRKPQQELPEDLKLSLDSSTNGVIYVSFGTNINPALLSPSKLQIFINVFSKLPYDVYWKWNDELMPNLTKNIKVFKWFPQSDLLMHPKIKLFITQGGLQSTDEAIAGSVPLIGIPMLWDQWYNVHKYVQLNIGLQLDIDTITEIKLEDSIIKVIEDKTYKDNIIKLHSVMCDQIQTPLERAVWWTEYVIRHGGSDHLRAPSANMSFIEYYEIELILYVATSLFLATVILLSILRMLFAFGNKIKTD